MLTREDIIKKFEDECSYKLTVIKGLLEEQDLELARIQGESYIENIDSISVFLAVNITETEEQHDRVLVMACDYIEKIRNLID